MGDGPGGGCTGIPVAGSQRAPDFIELGAGDDSLCSDTDYASARNPDGHDAAGAAADCLSFPAASAGNADRSFESDVDGPGADDGLVLDDAGAHPGGSAGG